MINIAKKDCCGCTACASICPMNCIQMVADAEGFLYPQIEKGKCIDCSLCKNVCPITNKPAIEEYKRKGLIVRSKDKLILQMSTSGGFFLPLVKKVLFLGGTVCAATYDKDFRIIHEIIGPDKESLKKLAGSKYVQSDIRNLFKKIREQLKLNKLVLFAGTPCQVAGLKNFLGKDYVKLLTVDVVCKGVGSPLIWEKYLQYQKIKGDAKINNISFRKKRYGYHSSTMAIEFENDRKYYGSGRIDFYLKAYYRGLISRPSCYNCAFKYVEHSSDFTLYDCWSPNLLNSDIKDDNKGYTNIIIQSKKGEEFFENIKNEYFYYSSNVEKAVELDGIMVKNSDIQHNLRNNFFNDIKKEDLADCIKKYIPITKKDYLIEKTKRFFYKLKILHFLKKFKRK